ncbi:MAG: type III-B CRISPR-associated protein Cas10/Cmr2 [Alphaproteobacteria bacterium]|uniref:Type III-B CRISPR-associated protein Cas10/Cmr2 n=1 Tax=Candidatus Nitrobium versatile TaxID=2884831 RepID=A0A953LZV0_9BACT|nr:type III-B CRISPR-associated protein Cas10/Cmr2 [Candidatus Nitrobium versatile]
MNKNFWQAKLAAWVHDPAEKALVLFRDRAGHEGGTVSSLCSSLFGSAHIPVNVKGSVKRADQWAAAADRPQIPWKIGERYPAWSRVRFSDCPVLVHPVSPKIQVDLRSIGDDIPVDQIKAVSFDHFNKLIAYNDDGSVNVRKTFLKFWRFGPELSGETNLGALWELLPADTRSPDHSIWDHLKLSSAFAGPFAVNDSPALLVVSLGPVQGFISLSRSTSDLWAGSHLLSRMAWEAMKVVCKEFGPDSVLFPDLHRIALVDVWLSDEEQIDWPEGVEIAWLEKNRKTLRAFDVNPLFSASLPNKFVAVVPAQQAADIAAKLTEAVRAWVLKKAEQSAVQLFRKAGMEQHYNGITRDQITVQLKGFPEIYWSATPWSLIDEGDRKLGDRVSRLKTALAEFYPEVDGDSPGFFKSDTWKVLQKTHEAGGVRFFEPNAGVCYPGLHDLSDRFHAAVKTARHFEQSAQDGYRCSLCGEREWLTHDRDLLYRPPDKRDGSVWKTLYERETSLVKKSEFLCAQCALKRFWPLLYAEEVKSLGESGVSRYIVSTHTMALTTSIARFIEKEPDGEKENKLQQLDLMTRGCEQAVFPRKLHRNLKGSRYDDILRRLPGLLDLADDAEESGADEAEDILKLIRDIFGRTETYYGLVLMDGDDMGAWLSGTNKAFQPKYCDILHPDVRGKIQDDGLLDEFMNTMRPSTPGRHQAISRALNHFSQDLARHMVEEVFKGKLIYSGGDDLLAMVSVDDLPGLMLGLRCLYAGHMPESMPKDISRNLRKSDLELNNGHALLVRGGEKKLYRLMGPAATCSIGAVIAHHKAPLGRVMRDLRATEKAAKAVPGKDAFSVRIDKRAGGTTHFTSSWMLEGMSTKELPVEESPMGAMLGLRNLLCREKMSRKAAYVLHDLFRDLPPDADILEKAMIFQLKRQGGKEKEDVVRVLAQRLAKLAIEQAQVQEHPDEKTSKSRGTVPKPNAWLQRLFITAEFLAREGRSEGDE